MLLDWKKKNENKMGIHKKFRNYWLNENMDNKGKREMIPNKLKDFNLEIIKARKQKRKGRAKGKIIFWNKKRISRFTKNIKEDR